MLPVPVEEISFEAPQVAEIDANTNFEEIPRESKMSWHMPAFLQTEKIVQKEVIEVVRSDQELEEFKVEEPRGDTF